MNITNEQLLALRTNGTITDEEIAILEGDLIVAKNVKNKNKNVNYMSFDSGGIALQNF